MKEEVGRTIDSTMLLHIPEPPPVQKRTLPAKMSGLNTAFESMTGVPVSGVDLVMVELAER